MIGKHLILIFSYRAGRCRLVNCRSKKGSLMTIVIQLSDRFLWFHLFLRLHTNSFVGSKINDDGHSRRDC